MTVNFDWPKIIAEIAPGLFRYFSTSFAPYIADDLVQITVTRLFEKSSAGHFNPAKGNLRMYAYGIANFVRLEQLRSPEIRRNKDAADDLISTSLPQDEMLDKSREIQRLREAIRALDETQQEVLALYINEELSTDQIGAILNMPANTVKSHVRRAKECLLQILEKNREAQNGR